MDGGIKLNAPFEIIDVSIPKGHDYGLRKLHANARRLLKTYTFGKDLTFMAPSVEYLLIDLHDLLFKQNEYPWTDVKYIKRMMRYFLIMTVFTIVERLEEEANATNLTDEIASLAGDFSRFAEKLASRDLQPEGWEKKVLHTLLGELRALRHKIENIGSNNNVNNGGVERGEELQNYEVFVDSLVASFVKLSNQLVGIVEKMDAQTEAFMRDKYVRIFKLGRSQTI
jgi:hypothetical protein